MRRASCATARPAHGDSLTPHNGLSIGFDRNAVEFFFVAVVAPTRAIHHKNRQRRTFCLPFFFLEPFFFFVGIWLKFLPVGKLGVISEGGARDRCSLFITVILRIDNWLGALGTKEGCKEAGESLAIGNRRRSTHTHTDRRTDGRTEQKAATEKVRKSTSTFCPGSGSGGIGRIFPRASPLTRSCCSRLAPRYCFKSSQWRFVSRV